MCALTATDREVTLGADGLEGRITVRAEPSTYTGGASERTTCTGGACERTVTARCRAVTCTAPESLGEPFEPRVVGTARYYGAA